MSTTTRADHTVHHTICRQTTTGLSWLNRCTCRHLRVRHTAATHAAIHTETGDCTGRNLAGACLIPGCPCTTFASEGHRP